MEYASYGFPQEFRFAPAQLWHSFGTYCKTKWKKFWNSKHNLYLNRVNKIFTDGVFCM